jgi:hypothetical protein
MPSYGIQEVPVMAKTKGQYDWECEEDLRAIVRADTVKADAKRYEKVKKLAKEKLDESKAEKEAIQRKIELGEGK